MVVDVHCDDPAGVHQTGALAGAQSDAAASEHGDRGAGTRSRVVDYGADAGGHAVADQRRRVHGHGVGNGMARLLGGHQRLGEHAQLGHLMDIGLALVQPKGPVVLPRARPRVGIAELRVPGATHSTVAAVGYKGKDAVVTGLDPGYALSHLGHRAGPLVAQHGRQWQNGGALHDVDVAGAEAGHAHIDADLSRFGRVLSQLLDLQRLVRLVQYGCFHGASPPV